MQTLEELKMRINSTPSLDDLIAAILHKSEQSHIPKAEAFFQQSFYQLKSEFPNLFDDFVFDESGIIPFSDTLDSVLFRLEASSMLSTMNPSYSSYDISSAAKDLEIACAKFSNERQIEINKCAKMFSQLVVSQSNHSGEAI